MESYHVSLSRRYPCLSSLYKTVGKEDRFFYTIDTDQFAQEVEPVSLVPEKPLAKRLMSRYASLLDSSFFKVMKQS